MAKKKCPHCGRPDPKCACNPDVLRDHLRLYVDNPLQDEADKWMRLAAAHEGVAVRLVGVHDAAKELATFLRKAAGTKGAPIELKASAPAFAQGLADRLTTLERALHECHAEGVSK
jgi:hypothetical protein